MITHQREANLLTERRTNRKKKRQFRDLIDQLNGELGYQVNNITTTRKQSETLRVKAK
jgi:hypothetical protein